MIGTPSRTRRPAAGAGARASTRAERREGARRAIVAPPAAAPVAASAAGLTTRSGSGPTGTWLATRAIEPAPIEATWLTLFEDRYGVGAYVRLIALLRQPCITFADIATRFGVTRERVRQWHLQLLPGAPTGHQRQRQCLVARQKRRLLEDELFSAFYRHARRFVTADRLTLIPSGDRFRKRAIRLDDRIVALKTARRHGSGDRPDGAAVYALTSSSTPVDFIYYQLTASDYLFVPRALLPEAGTTFIDTRASKYLAFKNTFAVASQWRLDDGATAIGAGL